MQLVDEVVTGSPLWYRLPPNGPTGRPATSAGASAGRPAPPPPVCQAEWLAPPLRPEFQRPLSGWSVALRLKIPSMKARRSMAGIPTFSSCGRQATQYCYRNDQVACRRRFGCWGPPLNRPWCSIRPRCCANRLLTGAASAVPASTAERSGRAVRSVAVAARRRMRRVVAARQRVRGVGFARSQVLVVAGRVGGSPATRRSMCSHAGNCRTYLIGSRCPQVEPRSSPGRAQVECWSSAGRAQVEPKSSPGRVQAERWSSADRAPAPCRRWRCELPPLPSTLRRRQAPSGQGGGCSSESRLGGPRVPSSQKVCPPVQVFGDAAHLVAMCPGGALPALPRARRPHAVDRPHADDSHDARPLARKPARPHASPAHGCHGRWSPNAESCTRALRSEAVATAPAWSRTRVRWCAGPAGCQWGRGSR